MFSLFWLFGYWFYLIDFVDDLLLFSVNLVIVAKKKKRSYKLKQSVDFVYFIE